MNNIPASRESIEALREIMRNKHPLTSTFDVDNCLGEAYGVTTFGTEKITMDVHHCLTTLCHLDRSYMFTLAVNAANKGEMKIYADTQIAQKELGELLDKIQALK